MNNENAILFALKKINLLKHLGLLSSETDDLKYKEVLTKILEEQEEKNKISDALINYNDEITEITFLGDKETIDISVTGDSLFYCNDILTKNSIGLASTCDIICSLWQTEEDRELGVINMGIQKNRFGPNFGHSSFKCNYETLTLKEVNPDHFEVEDPKSALNEASNALEKFS